MQIFMGGLFCASDKILCKRKLIPLLLNNFIDSEFIPLLKVLVHLMIYPHPQ